jgi:hypothetical protein
MNERGPGFIRSKGDIAGVFQVLYRFLLRSARSNSTPIFMSAWARVAGSPSCLAVSYIPVYVSSASA